VIIEFQEEKEKGTADFKEIIRYIRRQLIIQSCISRANDINLLQSEVPSTFYSFLIKSLSERTP